MSAHRHTPQSTELPDPVARIAGRLADDFLAAFGGENGCRALGHHRPCMGCAAHVVTVTAPILAGMDLALLDFGTYARAHTPQELAWAVERLHEAVIYRIARPYGSSPSEAQP